MENTSTKHISKLDQAQPSGSDAISEADDHFRFIKDCIKTTFSGITAVGSGNVTADAAELNKLDGYTGTTGDLNTIAGAVSSGLTTADIAKLASVSATATQLNNTANIPSNTNTSLNAKANLASPAFTGTPTAPTQSTSNNSTRIATTAYVTAKTSGIPTSANLASTNAAVALNTAYRGTNDAAVALKANSASPTISDANLTGTPTAPTAGATTNTTQLATTAFVQGLIDTVTTAVTQLAHPVNSIYITTTNHINSAAVVTALGLPSSATFERYAEGRTIVGYDFGDGDFGTVGGTGGAKTHILTTDELPAHDHAPDSERNHLLKTGNNTGRNFDTTPNEPALGANDNAEIASVGNNHPHNNLQPFIVSYIWRRTA